MVRALLLALSLVLAGPFAGAAEDEELRVMSFNIRYGSAKDGRNAWPKRRRAVVEAVEGFAPHVLGTQECLAFQRDYLLSKLRGYAAIGVGRDDGRERGEMAAIFYDRARFESLADGHFWLSGTPDKPGSVGWDASLPRVASWVLLADKHAEGRRVLVFNTHFDHRGTRAGIESARLVRAQVEALDPQLPVILLGDFNALESGPVHRVLSSGEKGEGGGRPLIDVYRALHPEAREADGTLSGFGAAPEEWRGVRIDWIFASRELVPREASVDRARYRGRYPSDHHPVRAVLTYRAEAEESP